MSGGLAALLAIGAIGCGEPADPLEAAAAMIDAERILSDATLLADDAMEGREAASEGYELAASWVSERYAALGLAPWAGGSDYRQEVPLFETRLAPDSARLVLYTRDVTLELEIGDDFVRWGGFGSARESVDAELVFAGHGIVAPEYEHDDYAGIEPGGKILVVLSGAPPTFETDLRAFYSSSRVKQAEAAKRGAVGLLTVRTPVDQKRRAWKRYLPWIEQPDMRWLDASGLPFQGYPDLTGNAILSEPVAAKLFELAGRDLEQLFEHHAEGSTGSFPLGVRASLERTSVQGIASSPNVVGVLEGSDELLRHEYVVYTAHLDHLGVLSEGDDRVYNGFYDNAVGVATLLEVARVMTGMAERPRRSIVFVALTAEEMGLLGSSFLVHNPPVPIEQIVANVNVDMPYLGFPIGDLEAFGAEHSTLGRVVERAAEAAGIALSPDSMPERVRFVRSDQFSFVQRGIPAVALKPGASSTDDRLDGPQMLEEFLSDRYHDPSDESDQPFDGTGAARFARTALVTGLLVAAEDDRPAWNEGDFFGDKFSVPAPR